MRELLLQRSLTAAYVRRALLLWIGVRLSLGAVMLLAGPEAADEFLRAWAGLPVVMAAVGYVDLVRRRERVMLANLGLSLSSVLAVFVAAAGVGELAIALSAAIRA